MSRYFPSPDECGHHKIFGNIPIRTYAGDHMQMSLVVIPIDGVVDWHLHANEQMGILISGKATFYVGEEVKDLVAGDMYWIPGGVKHKVVPIDGSAQAVDFFYPIRDEYR